MGEDGLRVDVYIRSSVPLEGVGEEVIERLEVLVEEEKISKYDVYEWPKEVEPESERESLGASRVFDELDDWARRNGVELQPFFEISERESDLTGESTVRVVLPVVCVRVRRGDEIEAVFPCCDGDEKYAVDDCLSMLSERTGIKGVTVR